MLPGMANFFGKSGMGTSILRGASRLNPIDLSRGQASRAWQHIVNTDSRHMGGLYDSARKTHRGAGPRWSGFDKIRGGVRGYFAGDNLSDMARNMGMDGLGATPAEARRRNKMVRRTVAGAAGAYAASNILFGQNNGISSAVGAGAQVGAHGSIMGLIGSRNPAAGAAYGAWAGLNALRPGNNMGPF